MQHYPGGQDGDGGVEGGHHGDNGELPSAGGGKVEQIGNAPKTPAVIPIRHARDHALRPGRCPAGAAQATTMTAATAGPGNSGQAPAEVPARSSAMNSRANPVPARIPVTMPARREPCPSAGCTDTSMTAGIATTMPAQASAAR